MSTKKRSAAVDALVAAGITSSDGDMAWILGEIKKREAKKAEAASEAAAAATEAAPTQGGGGTNGGGAQGGGGANGGGARQAPALTGKRATDATKEVFKHVARLKYQDEDWKARDEALQRLQVLIKDGALSCNGFISGFPENLKDLVHSLVAQLYDLRSVIVRSAVGTLKVLMTEVGDHAASERPFTEDVLEGLLQLASSGNKVLSAAGRDAFPHFVDAVRFESLLSASPNGLLHWLRGMKHVPVKMTCLRATLQALQTWPLALLTPAAEPLEIALVEAASNAAGEVRSIARQCLLTHLANTPVRRSEVDKWLARYPDTKKQLDKEASPPGALPPPERAMPAIRTGEAGAAARNGKLGGGAAAAGDEGFFGGTGGAGGAPKKPSLLKRLSTMSSLKADAAAPARGGKSVGFKSMGVRDVASMSAAERMGALNERKDEMSEEEYARERQAIIQSL